MKNLQAHWRSMAVLFAVVVLAGTFVLRVGTEGTALALVADPPYEVMTSVERDGVLTLLEEMDLDREALIALNPTAVQAESILATVRTWRDNEAATLAALDNTIALKVTAVRQLRAAIRRGPAQEGRNEALATARQELAAAHAAYNTARQSCEANINVLLSESQRTAWTALRGGVGSEMPIRLVSLTPQQRLDLSRERRHYNWRHAADRTKAERAATRTAHASAVDQILSVDQQAVVDAYQEYAETASQAVAEAFDSVLPLVEGT